MEPGFRMLREPWDFGPLGEVVALDRAGEALADRDTRDLDPVAGLEALDRDRLAGRQLTGPADLQQPAVRADLVLSDTRAWAS